MAITAEQVYRYLGIDFVDDDVATNVADLIATAKAYMIGALGENYPTDDARVIQV